MVRLGFITCVWAAFMLFGAQNAMAADCYAGQYVNSAGNCVTCPSGTYSSSGKATECTTIDPGYQCSWSNWVSLEPGEYPVMPIESFSMCSGQTLCTQGYYCPGGTSGGIECPSGWTTSGRGAVSVDECNVKRRTYCSAGTYNDGDDYCVDISDGYYGTGCSSNGTGCTGQAQCDTGYWCADGVRTACGDNMTTAGKGAKSADACICASGYEMRNGVCVEEGSALCDAGYYPNNGVCTACGVGYWCANDVRTMCNEGMTTTRSTATSESECLCPAGYYPDNGVCVPCPAGQYKPSSFGDSCYTVSKGYYVDGCNDEGVACTSYRGCGRGYYCSDGIRYQCPDENMTTRTTTASSLSDCICSDGYELVGQSCRIPGQQAACDIGISKLHVGEDIALNLYETCDSPALWIGVSNGACCANLDAGSAGNTLNIQIDKDVYHVVD